MEWRFWRRQGSHVPRHSASAPPRHGAVSTARAARPPASRVGASASTTSGPAPAFTLPPPAGSQAAQPVPVGFAGDAPTASNLRPSVQLGFRDGSTAELAADSPYTRALHAVADVLTHGPVHG